MYVSSLQLKNFRNYEALDISFPTGCTIITGDNAQGKTNILEALYISGTTKSHRSSKDKELIRFEQENAHIKAEIHKANWNYKIDIHFEKGKRKRIGINQIPLKKAADLFGKVNYIFFSPEDLVIVKEGPSHRRYFLDMELCQLSKVYFVGLANYQKILAQRNKLLKEYRGYKDQIMLDVLDEQLVLYGQQIIQIRDDFIKELNRICYEKHLSITNGLEKLYIEYEKNIDPDSFLKELKNVRNKDLYNKNTSIGPHKDDILFNVNGIDIRTYGSQGQQRTVALSLKLSEIEIVKSKINENPILLLDDVLSELDKYRQRDLISTLDGIQTIMTCTGMDEALFERLQADTIYEIKNGQLI